MRSVDASPPATLLFRCSRALATDRPPMPPPIIAMDGYLTCLAASLMSMVFVLYIMMVHLWFTPTTTDPQMRISNKQKGILPKCKNEYLIYLVSKLELAMCS